jgi:hypothetical protein
MEQHHARSFLEIGGFIQCPGSGNHDFLDGHVLKMLAQVGRADDGVMDPGENAAQDFPLGQETNKTAFIIQNARDTRLMALQERKYNFYIFPGVECHAPAFRDEITHGAGGALLVPVLIVLDCPCCDLSHVFLLSFYKMANNKG